MESPTSINLSQSNSPVTSPLPPKANTHQSSYAPVSLNKNVRPQMESPRRENSHRDYYPYGPCPFMIGGSQDVSRLSSESERFKADLEDFQLKEQSESTQPYYRSGSQDISFPPSPALDLGAQRNLTKGYHNSDNSTWSIKKRANQNFRINGNQIYCNRQYNFTPPRIQSPDLNFNLENQHQVGYQPQAYYYNSPQSHIAPFQGLDPHLINYGNFSGSIAPSWAQSQGTLNNYSAQTNRNPQIKAPPSSQKTQPMMINLTSQSHQYTQNQKLGFVKPPTYYSSNFSETDGRINYFSGQPIQSYEHFTHSIGESPLSLQENQLTSNSNQFISYQLNKPHFHPSFEIYGQQGTGYFCPPKTQAFFPNDQNLNELNCMSSQEKYMKNDHLISLKTLNFDVSNSSTQSPNSSNNESARGPLVRGSLAQAKLRSYSYKNNVSLETPLSGLSIKKTESLKVSKNPALPKLPPHSEHAIWVGNVPNDATVEELWNFFSSIPQKVQINQLHGKEQNNDDYEMGVNEILSNNGIKSIHIISKSNCAFINYISSQHLQKALLACNKKPLRSQTPTSKPLVCRIRKPEDNMKSGVGAQRIGGMHKSWIKKQKLKLKKNQNIENSMADPSRNLHKLNEFNTEALTEISESDDSDSTTPSFLANNFPSRYFILKSYTEEDLKISVEKSMWASQSHNEPVLDQAFRTSPKGVYLIFSVNKSGEFFGYAKMVGPIWGSQRRSSLPEKLLTRSTSQLSLLERLRRNSFENIFAKRICVNESTNNFLAENNECKTPEFFCKEQEFDKRLKSDIRSYVEKEETTCVSPTKSKQSTNIITGNEIKEFINDNNNLNLNPTCSNKQAIYKKLEYNQTGEYPMSYPQAEPYFHSFEDKGDNYNAADSGRPFRIKWLKIQKLPFHKTQGLKNPFNGDREVRISRDGTEVEPEVGEALIEKFNKESSENFKK